MGGICHEKTAYPCSGCFYDSCHERQRFALGNYVLSTDEVGTEEEEPIADEPELPAEPTGWAEQKVNPDTGAEDFVGVAAAAAAVAGIGLVALKKR